MPDQSPLAPGDAKGGRLSEVQEVDALELKRRLDSRAEGEELALFDVREAQAYGEGHPFFAVPLPYSRFETDLPRLAPCRVTPLVLIDADDGVAERAAARARAMGYAKIYRLRGGAQAWADAGFTLFQGVNVPSKTFGELLEIERGTPHISAATLASWRPQASAGNAHDDPAQRDRDAFAGAVVIDGRPHSEFEKMRIPGACCCPNGELVLHADELAPDPETTIVINCAGRTRSILGAQTLIDAGVANRVVALENGTQGWSLAGLTLAREASAPDAASKGNDAAQQTPFNPARRERIHTLASAVGVRFIDVATLAVWREDAQRTLYTLDVRPAEAFARAHLRGARHAPGGQVVQASDHWIGVRGARVVLIDDGDARAAMVAYWLRQMGHSADVLAGGMGALAAEDMAGSAFDSPIDGAAHEANAQALPATVPDMVPDMVQDLAPLTPHALVDHLKAATADRANAPVLLDVRTSAAFEANHIAGARWSSRPTITQSLQDALATADLGSRMLVLIGDEQTAALAAMDLREAGAQTIHHLSDAGAPDAWRTAGLTLSHTTMDIADRVDFVAFTHARHSGNEDHMRAYLSWELGLVDQLDTAERATFTIYKPSL